MIICQLNYRMEQEIFSGSYGVVIVPDEETIVQCRTLAQSFPSKVEYRVDQPHITLHIATFTGVPFSLIQDLRTDLMNALDQPLALSRLSIFSDRFLFWDLNLTPQLSRAHASALEVLSPYISRAEGAQEGAQKEDLKWTSQERENIRRFGYPFVLDLYRPHITLAYNSEGFANEVPNFSREARVSNVHFIEVGKYGSIRRIVL